MHSKREREPGGTISTATEEAVEQALRGDNGGTGEGRVETERAFGERLGWRDATLRVACHSVYQNRKDRSTLLLGAARALSSHHTSATAARTPRAAASRGSDCAAAAASRGSCCARASGVAAAGCGCGGLGCGFGCGCLHHSDRVAIAGRDRPAACRARASCARALAAHGCSSPAARAAANAVAKNGHSWCHRRGKVRPRRRRSCAAHPPRP